MIARPAQASRAKAREGEDGGGDAERRAAAQEGEAEHDAAERRRPSPATAALRRAGAARRGRGRPARSGVSASRPFPGSRSTSRAGLPAVIASKRTQSTGPASGQHASQASAAADAPPASPIASRTAGRWADPSARGDFGPSTGCGEVERQVEPVGDGEEPGLGAQQAGQGQQGQDRPAGAGALGLDQQGAEAEGDVGEVDVGAQAVGEEGGAGEDDRGGDGADPAVEPERAEPVDEVADQAQRGVGDRPSSP